MSLVKRAIDAIQAGIELHEAPRLTPVEATALLVHIRDLQHNLKRYQDGGDEQVVAKPAPVAYWRTEGVEGINRTPALAIALEGYAWLLGQGFAEPIIPVSWETNAIVGYGSSGGPLGVITFDHMKWRKEIHIGIGYVHPMARGQGLYLTMWNALVAHAQSVGALQIWGNTDLRNERMRSVAKSLGRVEVGVMIKFDVPKAHAP